MYKSVCMVVPKFAVPVETVQDCQITRSRCSLDMSWGLLLIRTYVLLIVELYPSYHP